MTASAPINSASTALSLFSGCGGFCEGIELAGFEIKAAVELDRFACETYRCNFPTVPLFEGDVGEFLNSEELRTDHLELDNLDLVFGGPPCQGFSQIGTRRVSDRRNKLYKQYMRIVGLLRPRMFLLENVPNLALMKKGHFRKLILRGFADLGYSNSVMIKVSSDEFGVPQTRQRVIFIGTRDEDEFPMDLEWFCEMVLEGLRIERPVSVDEAIGDLPREVVQSGETAGYPEAQNLSAFQRDMRLDFQGDHYSKAVKRKHALSHAPLKLHNHHTKEVQERRARIISLLGHGAKGDSLPVDIWNGSRPQKWRRLHPEKPSYTILAQMHRDLSEWIHPHANRWITVREAARLQSFHDGFVFRGSEWQQLKQIGNAVPPLLAHALGILAQETLSGLNTRQRPNRGASRAGRRSKAA